MKIACVLVASGRVPQLSESIASFINQDYENAEMVVVNLCLRQTLVFDHPKIRIYNAKTQTMPMRARNWAIEQSRGQIVVAWDELSTYLPGFLTQIANSMSGREWCWLEKEYCLELGADNATTLSTQQGSEFCFAFSMNAWAKCGMYQPGVGGASERNLLSRITKMFPGEHTPVSDINLIRMGTKEQREQTLPVNVSGQIKLQPAMQRDYRSVVEVAKSGKRESEVCVVSLGRYGDLIAILPVLKEIHDKYKKPHLMVSSKFADLLDGVSYVTPHVVSLDHSELRAAISQARAMYKIVLVGGCWGKGWKQHMRTPSYNRDEWCNLGFLHRFYENDLRPIFDLRDAAREQELLGKITATPNSKYGYDSRPMMLVNTQGISSPCTQCAGVFEDIKKVWGNDYNVVDLTQHRAHRLYDFLLTFETAVCLVSTDTSFLHLASATKIPVVALTSITGNGWGATLVRCGNAVNHIPYNKVNDNNRQELHESIAAAIQRPFGKIA